MEEGGTSTVENRSIVVPAQIILLLAVAVTPVGKGLTTTVTSAVSIHPPGLVTVTVYVVVVMGETDII
jgi:hypothetical protein